MRRKNFIKKVTIYICISSFMLFAAGCGSFDNASTHTEQQPGQATHADDQTERKIELPDHINTQLNEKIEVDANIQTTLDLSKALYSYQASFDYPDAQQLQNVFFEEGDTVTKNTDEDAKSFRCETPDGKKYAASYDNTVTFHRSKDTNYSKLLAFYSDNHHMYPDLFDTIETAEQLSFMTAEEAKGIVKETAKKLDITLAAEPFAFAALDETALKNLYDDVSADLADDVIQNYLPGVDFEGDKGCYYMIWQQQCPHGEIVMSNHYVDVDIASYVTGSFVMGIVNEHGLDTFYSFYRYNFTDEAKITDEIMGVDEALHKITELYEKVPLSEEYRITTITLQYAAVVENSEDGIVRIVPSWCIETAKDNYRIYIVDAVNGILL